MSDTKKPKKSVKEILATGARLHRMAAEAKKPFTKETLILPDGSCEITIGSLMTSECLTFDQAVEVMHRFRAEAGATQPSSPNANTSTDVKSSKPPKQFAAVQEEADDTKKPTKPSKSKASALNLAKDPKQSDSKKRKKDDDEALAAEEVLTSKRSAKDKKKNERMRSRRRTLRLRRQKQKPQQLRMRR